MAKLYLLFFCVIGIVLLGGLSGLLSMGFLVPYSGINAQLWYNGLNKLVDVPSVVFPIVWTLLYVLMGVSLYLVLISRGKGNNAKDKIRTKSLRLFIAQLFLNLLWSVVFFGLRLPAAALVEMVVLLSFIVLYMRASYKVSRTAGYLFLPYLIWVVFALFLNATIVFLN